MRQAARLGALGGAWLALFAAPAHAQEVKAATVSPPAERLLVTPSGVDMRSGRFAHSARDLSIGEDSETGGMALIRSLTADLVGHANPFANFSHNWDIMVSAKSVDIDESNFENGPDLRIQVHFGGRSESFDRRAESSSFEQTSRTAFARLTYTGDAGATVYTFTANDGTVAVFRALGGTAGSECSTVRACAYVSHIIHADGTRFVFTYDPGSPTRLRTVTSNRGYALLLHYGSGSDANHVTSACLINLAVQAIPGGSSCTGAQAGASYAYTMLGSARRLAAATDAGNGTSTFAYAATANGFTMAFTRPEDNDPWLTNTIWQRTNNEGQTDEIVTRQDLVDGADWTYAWTTSPPVQGEIPQIAGGSYIDPAGETTLVEYGFPIRPGSTFGSVPSGGNDPLTLFHQITPGPVRIVDPLGRISTQDYCDRHAAANLPSSEHHRCLAMPMAVAFTEAGGRRTDLFWDFATRNLGRSERQALAGPNADPIVTQASYRCQPDAMVNCAKPVTRTDPRGHVTNYVWDGTHGGLISETGPAPAPGAPRPQTRHGYLQRYARLAGGGQAATPVWVRAYTSTCRTSAATGDAEAACTAGALDEIYTSYDYGPDTEPNNLLLRGQVVYAESGGVIAAHRTCHFYDARGRRIGETGPNANPPSCAAVQTGAAPFTSNQRFDAMGRVTGTISADPDAVGSGNPHLAVRNSYDAAGRLIRVETGRLAAWQDESVVPANWTGFTVQRTEEAFYDAMGRKEREQLRDGGVAGAILSLTHYSYDIMGRLDCTAVRMNPAAFAAYQISPLPACTQGAQGNDRISRNIYDAAGQRRQLREGVGTADEAAVATWEYNPNGQVSRVIDGNGNRAALLYDGHGRQSCWMFPSQAGAANYDDSTPASAVASAGALGGVIQNGRCTGGDYEAYEYDSAGNRISLQKRDGSLIGYAYDNLNRLTVKTVPERGGMAATHTRDVYYGYDLRGLQTFARFDSASGEGVTSGWDGFGRLVSSSLAMDGATRTLSYQWDAGGRRTRITHPDNAFFSIAWDGLDRPIWLTDPAGSALAGFNYAPSGTPSGVGRPGATSGLQFGADGRLTSLSHYLGPNAGLDVNWTFTRNTAGQITSAARNNDDYAWTDHHPGLRSYTTNGLNQYTATIPAGEQGASFAYDLNGNLASDNGRAFVYDIENRLVAAAPNITLRYDPLGRLYELAVGGTVTRRFLYDGDALVAEYNSAGTMTARYVHGVGADVPLVEYLAPGPPPGIGTSTAAADRRNLLPDQLGSIVAVSNNAGTRLSINAYDDYGIPGAGNTGRFQYTGQIWLPELGVYYYKARLYSPTLGRFLQTDPIGYEDQFNLYAYVENDPVNRMDPTGTSCTESGPTPRCPRGEIIETTRTRVEGEVGSDEFRQNRRELVGSETRRLAVESMAGTDRRNIEYGYTVHYDARTNEVVSRLVEGENGGVTLPLIDGDRTLMASGHTHSGMVAPGSPIMDIRRFFGITPDRNSIDPGPSRPDVENRRQFPQASFGVMYQRWQGGRRVSGWQAMAY